jgi:hypothetical protein
MSLPITSGTITVSNTNGSIYYSNGTNTYSIYSTPKSKYNVLGKEIEVEGYHDHNLAITLSLINMLGLDFYIEAKNNNIFLPNEILIILEEELISHNRNKTIEKIIKEEDGIGRPNN